MYELSLNGFIQSNFNLISYKKIVILTGDVRVSLVWLWHLLLTKSEKAKKVLNASDNKSCDNWRQAVGQTLKLLSMSGGNAGSMQSTFCFASGQGTSRLTPGSHSTCCLLCERNIWRCVVGEGWSVKLGLLQWKCLRCLWGKKHVFSSTAHLTTS